MSDPDHFHFDAHIGYLSGAWMPSTEMRISVADLGFRQAVTVVERLRTYGGRVFQPAAHFDRWQRSLTELGIVGLPPADTLAELVAELFTRNERLIDLDGDLGITMFATPGARISGPATLGLHLNRLDHERIDRRRRSGQPLLITGVAQPPPASWPRSIKVRCRLHYFRADCEAQQSSHDAAGILLDQDGSLTETSVANLAMIRDGVVISPPADRVLPGVTQQVIESLAAKAGIVWQKQPVLASEFIDADEIVLMGTDTGIWFGSKVGEQAISSGQPGPIYQRLRNDFDALTRPR